jgi:chaperonin GroEL
MAKPITFGGQFRQAIPPGVTRLANAVQVTRGLEGHTILDKGSGSPMLIKDGVIVAKEIDLRDPPWLGR